ncbi:hypothetical protein A3F62_04895 [Candidatus Woesebacteria bacterium RIFCSPHIGHO2_12_FULL_44_11]|nr:MAG: hypothetical protein A3F62_04895 [Candidatus Woesebacteria bacterium RIFCSPHIGHO2_12_FULL_44_11]
MALKLKGNTALIWPLVVLAIAFGAFWLKPWQTKPTETISVTAEGKAHTAPNVATITATIETKNKDLDKARDENGQMVSTIVAKLKDLGTSEKDIKTQNISGGPGYQVMDMPQTQIYPAPPRPNTNSFSTSLEITVRNFDIADEVLAALTQNGATNLFGPNLTLDETAQEETKSKARENAVESARKKAEELAKLSGRKLGKAVKIQEQGDYGYPVPILARGEADLKDKASLIQPGQNEVSINLAVDFELK